MRHIARGLRHILMGIVHMSVWLTSLVACIVLVAAVTLAAMGIKPIVVTSGSMVPFIPVGSIVLVHSVPVDQIHPGDVVTVYEPSYGHRVTHRVLTAEPKGSQVQLTLKGDANKTVDSSPVVVSKVLRLQSVIPGIGRPVMALRSSNALVLLGMLLMLTLGAFGISARASILKKRHMQPAESVLSVAVNQQKEVVRVTPAVVQASVPAAEVVRVGSDEIDIRGQETGEPKSDLLLAMSHDFRAPFTTLLGYLEILSEGDMGELDPKQQHAVSAMSRSADRLSSLVSDLFVVAQIEQNSDESNVETINVTDCVQSVVQAARTSAEDRSVSIDLRIEDDLGVVSGNNEQFATCITHLLSNAVKFSPEGGVVIVRGFRAAGMVNLCISDSGLGIDAEARAHLFEHVETSGAEITALPSSGLGLPIVKAIVGTHGGTIEVDTKSGRGSMFTVKFPEGTSVATS